MLNYPEMRKMMKFKAALEIFEKYMQAFFIIITIFPFLYCFFYLYISEQFNREYRIIEYIDNCDDADSLVILHYLKDMVGEKEFIKVLNHLAFCGTHRTRGTAGYLADLYNYQYLSDLYDSFDSIQERYFH